MPYFPVFLDLDGQKARVAGGGERIGQRLWVPMPGSDIEIVVATSPVFYDPSNERLDG